MPYRALLLLGLLALVAGCGDGTKVVPVSGTVYVDGKPKAGLHVNFQPMATKDNINPGRGSHGITDAEGKYVLKYDGTDREGAVVGKHRVAISTVMPGEGQNFDPETGSPDGVPQKGAVETIPIKYNDKTELTIDVPTGGKKDADFRLDVGGKKK